MKNKFFTRKKISSVLFGLSMSLPMSGSAGILDELDRVLDQHQLIMMVREDTRAAKEGVKSADANWLPSVNANGSYGWQDIDRDIGDEGDYSPSEFRFGLNQLIYDFGKTKSLQKAAKKELVKEESERDLQEVNLLLAAVEAHMKLIGAHLEVEFARASEANIKEQARLESARLEAGKGYSTDVLQAKSQLAAAEARRIFSENRLESAQNRYQVIFGELPDDIGRLEVLQVPVELMPSSLDEVITHIQVENPDVVVARNRAERALAEARRLDKDYMPRVSADLKYGSSREFDGVEGDRQDVHALVRFDWGWEFGRSGSSITRGAMAQYESSQHQADYILLQAREETRNAWFNWVKARQEAEAVELQASIARQFLEMARKERELGRRSLTDVLDGETNLINARSDAVQARIRQIVAAYQLLRSSGGLSLAGLRQANVVGASASEVYPEFRADIQSKSTF